MVNRDKEKTPRFTKKKKKDFKRKQYEEGTGQTFSFSFVCEKNRLNKEGSIF
jgi:hypothetical protein